MAVSPPLIANALQGASNQVGNMIHLRFFHTPTRDRRRADTHPAGHKGRARIKRDRVFY